MSNRTPKITNPRGFASIFSATSSHSSCEAPSTLKLAADQPVQSIAETSVELNGAVRKAGNVLPATTGFRAVFDPKQQG